MEPRPWVQHDVAKKREGSEEVTDQKNWEVLVVGRASSGQPRSDGINISGM